MADDRREYLELRERVNRVEQEAAKGFDKALLTLSAGALFLTVAYRREIVPAPAPNSGLLLLASWGSFAWSLCAIVSSYIATQYTARDARKRLDHSHNPEHPIGSPTPNVSRWWLHDRFFAWLYTSYSDPGDVVDRLNLRSVAAFTLGVLFLLAYAAVNMTLGGKP